MQLLPELSYTNTMNWTVYELVEKLRSKHTLIALWLSAAILVVVLATVSHSAWNKRTTKKIDYTAQNVKPLQSGSKTSATNVERVVSANLFGNPTPVVAAVAPQTTLNLTLQGVLSATSPLLARAIIQAGNSPGALYSVGDVIQGAGASVEEIKPSEVLLNRAGAIERLPLNTIANSKGANITFGSVANQESAREVASFDSGERNNKASAKQARRSTESVRKPDSPIGERRKIKRPSFSGLERAIKRDRGT